MNTLKWTKVETGKYADKTGRFIITREQHAYGHKRWVEWRCTDHGITFTGTHTLARGKQWCEHVANGGPI